MTSYEILRLKTFIIILLDAIYQKSAIFEWGKPCIFQGGIEYFPAGNIGRGGYCLKNMKNYLNLYNFLNRDKLQAMGLGNGLIGYLAFQDIDPLGEGGVFLNRPFPSFIGQHFNIRNR